jgi:hypothetical protein
MYYGALRTSQGEKSMFVDVDKIEGLLKNGKANEAAAELLNSGCSALATAIIEREALIKQVEAVENGPEGYVCSVCGEPGKAWIDGNLCEECDEEKAHQAYQEAVNAGGEAEPTPHPEEGLNRVREMLASE